MRKKLFIVLLLGLLLLISLVSLKPGLYLAGWDNFSVSLNPGINISRTWLATWREYRGLGVPSDSEVVDIFRQFFFLALSLIFKKPLLEQIYLLLCLNVGVVAFYFLAKKIIAQSKLSLNKRHLSLGALISAFFYLFNLNTLSIFYFPMTMYVSRFALFPLVVLFWLRFLTKKKIRVKAVFLFLSLILFFSASYLTATLFFTLLIILGLITLSNLSSVKKNLVLFSSLILLNAFWLLPFLNYTVKKANLIPQASTYIEANEIQLNQPPADFVWSKLLTFWPTSFATEAENVVTGQRETLHPLVDELRESFWEGKILLVLSFFALIGIFVVFKKKRKKLFWLPSLFFLSLFLLRKEYPPLGFVFDFLGEKIPLFKIVFRFGGEKFYPLLLISSCLLTAIAFAFIFRLLTRVRKEIAWVAFSLFLLFYLYPFRFYFTGRLVSPLMYTKIPQAYFEIAKIINQDPETGRVLHLPEEALSYWKTYSWGYVGSSFSAFTLNKPLIEKTFVPASLENDYWLDSFSKMAGNSQLSGNQEEKLTRLAQLLKRAQVKYIIWDESVRRSVPLRGLVFWGSFAAADSKQTLRDLEERGFISLVSEQSIDLSPYLDLYPESRKLDQEIKEKIRTDTETKIQLFRVNNNYEPVLALDKSEAIDPQLDNLFIDPLLQTDETLIQKEGVSHIAFPFYQFKSELKEGETQEELILPGVHLGEGETLVSSQRKSKDQSVAIQLKATREDDNLIVDLFRLDLPFINNRKLQTLVGRVKFPIVKLLGLDELDEERRVLSDWHVLPQGNRSQLRLAVDGLVLPLPIIKQGETKELGTVLVENKAVVLEVLGPEKEKPLSLSEFKLTEDPNCFGDRVEGYQYELKAPDGLSLTTQNGSSCLIKPLNEELDQDARYFELGVDYSFEHQEFGSRSDFVISSRLQKSVREEINSLPTSSYFTFCLVDGFTGGCLNNHQAVKAQSQGKILLSAGQTTDRKFLQLLLALPTVGYQQNRLGVQSVILKKFESLVSETVEISEFFREEWVTHGQDDDQLAVSFPKIISRHSYYFNPEVDALTTYNQPCLGSDSYRATKEGETTTLFYNENCQNGVALNLNFDSDNFYLWQVDYHLFSSKYPKFILKGKLRSYQNEYLSIHQGYPDVPGFKSFQKADSPTFLFRKLPANEYVEKQLRQAKAQTAFVFLYPQLGSDDNQDKVFMIEQNSENQGLFAVSDFNLIQLPGSWQNLVVKTGKSENNYLPLSILSTKKVLPSLWQAQIAKSKGAEGKSLLVLNQAFDDQWQAYRGSVLNALLGRSGLNADKVKVNGWANGWEVERAAFEEDKAETIYFFYTPERLAILGWVITALTFAAAPLALSKIWPKLKD